MKDVGFNLKVDVPVLSPVSPKMKSSMKYDSCPSAQFSDMLPANARAALEVKSAPVRRRELLATSELTKVCRGPVLFSERNTLTRPIIGVPSSLKVTAFMRVKSLY